jgi:phenylalanine-4-hydroxylase
MESNEVLDRLPRHLMDLVIEQPYNEYTAQDHAVWRYIMRQNVHYLPKVAHGSYLEGLRKTGISTDTIPRMYGMNRILKEIGWAAVAVDGFIPPAAFMEFQAHHVLVIAADIRPITQVGYTPAPDIVHEAAGHAPIIADPEYADYLVEFGKIGSKAFSSKKDMDLYEAIRLLSILKADPYSPVEKIREAEEQLEAIGNTITEPSELSQIRNLHWWTVEYGLIGDLRKPKIFGAGLLSSISESYNCLQDPVKKIPYSIAAAQTAFDITTQQPQLFVTPDFAKLSGVLEEFASGMALRKGGIAGLEKARETGEVATVVWSSGLQASGIVGQCIELRGEPAYIRFSSATALSYNNTQIEGQGKGHHAHGFGSPAGRIEGTSTPPERMTDEQINAFTDKEGITTFRFESGVEVCGMVSYTRRHKGLVTLISFTGCRVTIGAHTLFDPDWGIYDMAVGEKITSVFPGPADPSSWGLRYPVPRTKTHKIVHGDRELHLHSLYRLVRGLRDSGEGDGQLRDIWEMIAKGYPEEWLLPLEILELADHSAHPELPAVIRLHLERLKKQKEFAKLVDDGLTLLSPDIKP